MKTKTILGTLILIVLIFNACKKPKDGDTGPQGAPGNANVQNYSITVSPSQWIYDNLYERWYYRYSSAAEDNSAIYAYVMSGSGKQAMPYYSCEPNNAWCEQYDMATYLFGNPPYIEFQFTNYISRTTAPTYDKYFYLIIIPPAQRLAYPDVDYTNYEAVKKGFNLKD